MANGITRKRNKTEKPHESGCMCSRCRRNRQRTFDRSARFAANRLESQGNRSATAALPNDGIFTTPYTRPAMQSEVMGVHDDGTPIIAVFCQTDDAGNLIPDTKFEGKGISDTQLKIKPLFSPSGRTKQQQHSDAVVMTPADRPKDMIGPMPLVETVVKVHQTSGLVPVRSLLRRSANFDPDWGSYKRRTSRSKEITRPDKGHGPIDPDVSRLSYRRPDHLIEQSKQEAKLMELDLGLPDDATGDITSLVVDAPTDAETMPESIDDVLADLTDWD